MRRFSKFLLTLAAFLGVLIGCGVYDVTRNRALDSKGIKRYFTGNGILTWLLSPFNTVLDLLSLPHTNKGIYKLDDLPATHQAEIKRLIDAAYAGNLVSQLEEKIKDRKRSMFFFKWYGSNIDNGVDFPAYHANYEFVKTIGVSVFNKRQSTSKHFGPVRATLRVLYNLNDMDDHSAYIEVGDVKHYWKDEKLFIFDDTLQHQSFNESDKARYCLFVDILRPTEVPQAMSAVVGAIRFCLKGYNGIFYKNWDVIKN